MSTETTLTDQAVAALLRLTPDEMAAALCRVAIVLASAAESPLEASPERVAHLAVTLRAAADAIWGWKERGWGEWGWKEGEIT